MRGDDDTGTAAGSSVIHGVIIALLRRGGGCDLPCQCETSLLPQPRRGPHPPRVVWYRHVWCPTVPPTPRHLGVGQRQGHQIWDLVNAGSSPATQT